MATGNLGRLAGAVRDNRGRIVKPAGGNADDAGTGAGDGGADRSADSGSSDPGGQPDASPVDPGTGFAEPTRPKRGRPRNADRGTGPARTANPTRKRQTSAGVAAVGQSSLTDTIVEIHEFLADLTSIKRLELERDKAARLGKALGNANQHVRIPMLNSRNASLAILAWTVLRIYGPMVKDVMMELDNPRALPSPKTIEVANAASPPSVVTSAGIVTVPPSVPASAEDAALNEWIPRVAN